MGVLEDPSEIADPCSVGPVHCSRSEIKNDYRDQKVEYCECSPIDVNMYGRLHTSGIVEYVFLSELIGGQERDGDETPSRMDIL